MGIFQGIRDARMTAGGVYFLPGEYIVLVQKVFLQESRKREVLFIAECLIQASSNPERREGQRCSWVVKMSQDAAMGNIKRFLAACCGIEPSMEAVVNEEITEELAEVAVSDGNPLAGTIVGLQATNIKTREGNDFTLHEWQPVSEAA